MSLTGTLSFAKKVPCNGIPAFHAGKKAVPGLRIEPDSATSAFYMGRVLFRVSVFNSLDMCGFITFKLVFSFVLNYD